MLEQNVFTETVREVSEIIRTAQEPLSREEILRYFDKMELNEKQKEMVLEYLLKPQTEADSKAETDADFQTETDADSQPEAGANSQPGVLPDSQAFRMYLKEIEGLSVCGPEELREMYEKLLNGDNTVIGKISESWMGRILEQVKQLPVGPEDFSDVVQEGNMALFMKLSELCGSGVQDVESELIREIESAMKSYIQQLSGEDDVENAVVGKVTLVNEARKYLMEENGQEPSLRALSEYTKMSVNELRSMMEWIRKAEQRDREQN